MGLCEVTDSKFLRGEKVTLQTSSQCPPDFPELLHFPSFKLIFPQDGSSTASTPEDPQLCSHTASFNLIDHEQIMDWSDTGWAVECPSLRPRCTQWAHFYSLIKATCPGLTYLCEGAYLLYDRGLHATRLHLLLQEDLLLRLLDDVLSPVGGADNLQDLTWETTKQKGAVSVILNVHFL